VGDEMMTSRHVSVSRDQRLVPPLTDCACATLLTCYWCQCLIGAVNMIQLFADSAEPSRASIPATDSLRVARQAHWRSLHECCHVLRDNYTSRAQFLLPTV